MNAKVWKKKKSGKILKNYAKIERLRWSSKYFYTFFLFINFRTFLFLYPWGLQIALPKTSNNVTEASDWDENLDSLISRKFKTRQNHVLSRMVMYVSFEWEALDFCVLFELANIGPSTWTAMNVNDMFIHKFLDCHWEMRARASHWNK